MSPRTDRCRSPSAPPPRPGLVSFLSPCVLPLVPGLSVLCDRPGRRRPGCRGRPRTDPQHAPSRVRGRIVARLAAVHRRLHGRVHADQRHRWRHRPGAAAARAHASRSSIGAWSIVLGVGVPRVHPGPAARVPDPASCRRPGSPARPCSVPSSRCRWVPCIGADARRRARAVADRRADRPRGHARRSRTASGSGFRS